MPLLSNQSPAWRAEPPVSLPSSVVPAAVSVTCRRATALIQAFVYQGTKELTRRKKIYRGKVAETGRFQIHSVQAVFSFALFEARNNKKARSELVRWFKS
jgi:hypothetical protein